MVAEVHLGPKPLGMEINHKDGVKTNNHVNNLEYCSKSDNMKHAYKIGLLKHLATLRNQHKFTADQIREIRSSSMGYERLAKLYKVNEKTMHKIRQRKHYKWVEDAPTLAT